MTDVAALALNGHALHSVTLVVGEAGAWVADCRLTEAPDLPTGSAATLDVAGAKLVGTVTESTAFGLAAGARIVGGAGGWAKTLRKRSYHNDAGVKAQLVAEDAARECGETLGTFAPGVLRVGNDYARREASAAVTLEYAAGGVPWWVDYAGVTHVAQRAADTVPADAYKLLAYNQVDRVAQLAVDDFSQLAPGRTLIDSRLPGPVQIRDIELLSTKGSPVRATVWCGDLTRADAGRLADLMRSIVSRLTPNELLGVYRYRVVTMRGDRRCDLQAVRQDIGLPDLPAVSQWPGTPGLAARLTEGVQVLVSFIDGDPNAPFITGYAGPGAADFSPVEIIIGDDAGAPAARQGDAVEVLIPPAMFSGTISGAPASGVVTWLMPKADGQIVGGSGKVRIA